MSDVKRIGATYKDRNQDLERDVAQMQTRLDAEKQQIIEVFNQSVTIKSMTDQYLLQIKASAGAREVLVDQKKAELRKHEDRLVHLKKELEQKLREVATTSTSSEGDSEKEGLLVCAHGSEKLGSAERGIPENTEMFDVWPELPQHHYPKMHAQ